MGHPIFPTAPRRSLRSSARLRVAVAVLVGVLPLAGSAQLASAAGASTAYSPVDFSSQANFTWVAPQTDPNGAKATYFPGGPVGSITLGGIPFNIRSNAAGFQAWNGYVASKGKDGTVSLTIPVNIHGATNVYTLINTYWGASGSSYTALVFTGSGGATYTDHLFEGSNIRGWCCVGSINGTSTTNVFTVHGSPINGAQGFLDMQHIVLPPVFATQTLTSIQVVDSGATAVQRTVLDGVTVLSTAAAATMTTTGTIQVWATPSPTSAVAKIVITGVIGDYGTATTINKNGTVNANGNYVKIVLQHGGFDVNSVALNKIVNAAPPMMTNATTCSVVFGGSGPNTLFDGTGMYAGISGTVQVTERFAGIGPRYTSGPKKGQCNMNNNTQPIAFWGSITGMGKVSFG